MLFFSSLFFSAFIISFFSIIYYMIKPKAFGFTRSGASTNRFIIIILWICYLFLLFILVGAASSPVKEGTSSINGFGLLAGLIIQIGLILFGKRRTEKFQAHQQKIQNQALTQPVTPLYSNLTSSDHINAPEDISHSNSSVNVKSEQQTQQATSSIDQAMNPSLASMNLQFKNIQIPQTFTSDYSSALFKQKKDQSKVIELKTNQFKITDPKINDLENANLEVTDLKAKESTLLKQKESLVDTPHHTTRNDQDLDQQRNSHDLSHTIQLEPSTLEAITLQAITVQSTNHQANINSPDNLNNQTTSSLDKRFNSSDDSTSDQQTKVASEKVRDQSHHLAISNQVSNKATLSYQMPSRQTLTQDKIDLPVSQNMSIPSPTVQTKVATSPVIIDLSTLKPEFNIAYFDMESRELNDTIAVIELVEQYMGNQNTLCIRAFSFNQQQERLIRFDRMTHVEELNSQQVYFSDEDMLAALRRQLKS